MHIRFLLFASPVTNFGHLMRRTDSLEKTLMLGKIEGRRRRGHRGEADSRRILEDRNISAEI